MWAMGDGCDTCPAGTIDDRRSMIVGGQHETRDVVLNDASRVVSGSNTTKYFGGDDIGRGISMISADIDADLFVC